MFKNHDAVKVTKGEYKDLIGTIEGHTDKEVKFYCVGKVQVWLPYDYVTKVEVETSSPMELSEDAQKALNDYLCEVVRNSYRCAHCDLCHCGEICFFAYDCIKNDFQYCKWD